MSFWIGSVLALLLLQTTSEPAPPPVVFQKRDWNLTQAYSDVYKILSSQNTASPANLPLMWERQTSFDMAGPMTENLVMLSHLTGNRRAKEGNEDFFRAAKSYWTATAGRNMTCPIRYLTIYAQGYAFNGDREMADMARATLNELYDPQAALLVNQIVYSASYKVQEDIHNLIHAWWALGDQKFYDLALTRSRFLFNKHMGTVVSYQSAQGIVSSFLYRQT